MTEKALHVENNRIRLIVNPNADLGRAWYGAADLRPIVEEHGGIEWVGSGYPTHATELAREAGEKGYDLVIAAGGDGTVHEVVNGLMQFPAEHRPRLGIVPLGSGNDFSHAIGINPNPPLALRQALSGRIKQVDVVRYWDDKGRDKYFVNTLGIGFDTIVTIRSRRIRFFSGFLIYLSAVIQTILLDHEAPLIDVRTDQESFTGNMMLLVLCNGSREGGGFRVCPEARPDDGILHFTALERISRLHMFRLLPEFMKGTHARFKQVRSGAFQRIELEADRALFIHADGEIYAGWGTDLRKLWAEILPGGLAVNV